MTPESNATFPHLLDDVWQALKQWHGDATAPSPLEYLYLFRAARREAAGNTRRITNEILRNALETLKQSHFEDAGLLQQRFLDLLPVHRLANQMNVAESTAYQLQKQAIERLTAALQQMEEEASAAQKKVLRERLEPSSYTGLIGIEAAAATLETILVKPEAPWLIALEGIGGIGKTSLADFVLRRLIGQAAFDEVGWVTARQFRLNFGGAISTTAQPALTAPALVEKLAMQLLPGMVVSSLSAEELLRRLQAHVKAVPHLIVIDNLETLPDVESLLPTLQLLSNPSKFLLTSRQSLRVEPNIYHVTVPELSEENALHLIRQEAALSNLPLLAACTDEELVPIFKTVGGNPLALRLVAGQTHVHALEAILQDLEQARGETVENLYTFIYRRAWDSLDQRTRKVLLAMPLAQPGGESLEFLTKVCRLEVGDVRLALNKLVLQNLVDARGGLHERRYSIHGLTRTFLQEQVAKWQQPNADQKN